MWKKNGVRCECWMKQAIINDSRHAQVFMLNIVKLSAPVFIPFMCC